MAIPATNINLCAHVANQIYGDIPVTCKSLCQALCSANISVPHSILSFANCSASLSRTPTSAAWATPGACTITITALSAWCLALTQTPSPAIWSISYVTGKVVLNGSGVYGGSGTISISRNANYCYGATGTLTICYSNGAGGRTSTTVTLSTTW
jgi:hypothetical protein